MDVCAHINDRNVLHCTERRIALESKFTRKSRSRKFCHIRAVIIVVVPIKWCYYDSSRGGILILKYLCKSP